MYIGHPNDIVNKIMLFASNLTKARPFLGAKVVIVFVDYSFKMEKILEEMKNLFAGLETKVVFQSMIVERVSNLSISLKVISNFDM